MFSRQRLSPIHSAIRLGAAVLVAGTLLAAATPARADDAAEAYVSDLGSQAIGILGDDSLSPDEERAQFRALLLGALDIRRLGLFTLGQYARLPTEKQKDIYFALLADFIVEVYYGRLRTFSNETFEVRGSVEKGNKGREAVVSSEINFADGSEPLPVQWWLIRDRDGNFSVFDVNVSGIWMAQEQRGTFTSQIRNNGGNFDALLDHLRRQIANAGAQTAAADSSG